MIAHLRDHFLKLRRNLHLEWGRQWRLRSRLRSRGLRDEAACYLRRHESDLFFLLGSGRSGTQLLTGLLRQNDDVCVFHEPNFREDVGTMDELRRKPQLALDYWREFRSIEVYKRWRENPRSRLYGEVNGTIRFQAPAIRELYPKAKVFLICRDGRSVVRSVMGWPQFYSPGSSGAYALAPLAGDPYASHWAEMSRFQKICWFWKDTNNFLMQYIPVDNWLQLERLASDYDYCCERLLGPLGIELSFESWRAHVSKKSRNATSSYGFPAWEAWSAEQKRIFEYICGDEMARLGYEL